LFLETLGETGKKTDWPVRAWFLMSNHSHLLSETPWGNLVLLRTAAFLGRSFPRN
jgi:hypothetical protein